MFWNFYSSYRALHSQEPGSFQSHITANYLLINQNKNLIPQTFILPSASDE